VIMLYGDNCIQDGVKQELNQTVISKEKASELKEGLRRFMKKESRTCRTEGEDVNYKKEVRGYDSKKISRFFKQNVFSKWPVWLKLPKD